MRLYDMRFKINDSPSLVLYGELRSPSLRKGHCRQAGSALVRQESPARLCHTSGVG
jgi:hypothetical protein